MVAFMIYFLTHVLFCVGKMVFAFCLHKKEMGKVIWHNLNDFCIAYFISIGHICLTWNMFNFLCRSESLKLCSAYFFLWEVLSSEALTDLKVGDKHKTGYMLLEYELCGFLAWPFEQKG